MSGLAQRLHHIARTLAELAAEVEQTEAAPPPANTGTEQERSARRLAAFEVFAASCGEQKIYSTRPRPESKFPYNIALIARSAAMERCDVRRWLDGTVKDGRALDVRMGELLSGERRLVLRVVPVRPAQTGALRCNSTAPVSAARHSAIG